MIRTTRFLYLGACLCLWGSTVLPAQHWSGSIEVAGVGQDTSGSEESYRTQLNLDDGVVLERFELRWTGAEENDRELRFTAWGFGNAEPVQGADLLWRPAQDWRLEAEYRRHESFFGLAETGDLGGRHDDWRITRFRSRVTWDGWKPLRLSLGLGLVERSGVITQPFRELTSLYLLGVDLDETRSSASLRLETRDFPVRIVFEQSLAQLERRNRWFPALETDLDGENPALFVDAANDRVEKRDVPVSRLTAAWKNDRVEVTGALLYSPADFDVTGETSTTFGLAGDTLGRVGYVEDLMGTASFDTLFAHLDLGLRLAPRWSLRLGGRHRDRSQDSTLLGARILRLSNSLGDSLDIPLALDEETFFDVTDTGLRLELEHRRNRWTLWAGFFDTRREVDYRIEDTFVTDNRGSVDRDSDGVLLGASYRLGRKVKASFEYETGDFEQYVFRNDPETVDRYTLKLRTDLGHGFLLQLRRRYEQADNPPAQSTFDREAESTGVGLIWSSEDGQLDFGLDVDQADLTTETDLVFPGGGLGLSRYDVSLLNLGAHARATFGRVTLTGSLFRIEDDGETWPLETLTASARLTFALTETTEMAVFGRYDDYDETLSDGDDFEVTRSGVAFAWRFR